jgi:hypothetical protein
VVCLGAVSSYAVDFQRVLWAWLYIVDKACIHAVLRDIQSSAVARARVNICFVLVLIVCSFSAGQGVGHRCGVQVWYC